MTPGARLQACIELIAELETADRPAERVIASYCRGRRYMGSGDRRAVADLTYRILRQWQAVDWAYGPEAPVPDARGRVLLAAALDDGGGLAGLEDLCAGGRYDPAPLTTDERMRLTAALARADGMPDWARCNVPHWLAGDLAEAFGEGLAAEMNALNQSAPVDIRVNTMRSDRRAVAATLHDEGIDVVEAPLSPVGLRLPARCPITDHALYRDGTVEVQDEGSQCAALLADARPGQTVIDACAGGGGKTLAMAAAMAGRGRLIALDADAGRLARMEPRLARAGLGDFVERVHVPPDAGADSSTVLPAADRVLVDAPCSGTGTWRRDVDSRRRLTPKILDGLLQMQAVLLRAAAASVAPGGRLIYVTCSVLPAENERQVDRFLAGSGGFATLPVDDVWREALGNMPPPQAGETLRLTPASNGTDGFFVAILVRRA